MQKAPQQELLCALNGGVSWAIISVALQTNLFDRLLAPVTAVEVAKIMHWQLPATEGLLDALTALNYVNKKSACYQLAQRMTALLTSHSDNTMLPTLLHLNKLRVKSADEMLALLKTPPCRQKMDSFKAEAFWTRATENLRAFHKSTSSDYFTELITSLPEWSNAESMLDIGAGSLVLAQQLLSERPTLNYHIFDLPGVISQLQQLPADSVQAISRFHAGDYNETPIPRGFDIVFASMSLYYAKSLTALLSQIHSALNPDGVFISCHEGLTRERTQPAYHVVGRLVPTLSGNNVSFDQGDIANAMLEAGFRRVQSRSINTPFGPFDLDIGYH